MITVMGREEEGGEMIEMKMELIRHCICEIMMIVFVVIGDFLSCLFSSFFLLSAKLTTDRLTGLH